MKKQHRISRVGQCRESFGSVFKYLQLAVWHRGTATYWHITYVQEFGEDWTQFYNQYVEFEGLFER